MKNMHHSTKHKRATAARLALERLEPRFALDAEGVIFGADVHLTLSFAPEGTSIAGQGNQLAALFDTIAPREVWQEKILTAFQTWAVYTNADIGVVTDGGQAFGTPGLNQGDARFGDIRIGAISMAPNVAAVSVPIDGVVSGTWFGDVLFNTAYNYQTLDDILAIAMHEAGNVFGLKDNNDPNSPLHPGDPPQVRQPTPTDIALLQGLHGTRVPDLNELSQASGNTIPDNDSFANATELVTGEIGGMGHGSAPTVVYGDITSATDNDFFYVALPSNYGGALTLEARTQAISLLKPHVRIYDQSHTLVAEDIGSSMQGNRVTVMLPAVVEDETYYFQITNFDGTDLNTGAYSLTLILDDVNQIPQAQIDAVAGGAYRSLPAEEIAKLFDPEEDFLNDDEHTDDDVGEALQLPTAPGFVEDSRYEVIGSIVDGSDVDVYDFKAPNQLSELSVATISVRSLDLGSLMPHVELLDEDGNPVATTIVANGGGDLIIQASGISLGDDYLVRVRAAEPGGPFGTGNYKLTVAFGREGVAFDSLNLDPWPTVGNGTAQNLHTLYVGKPQLFHFVLEAADVPVTTPTVLVATFLNNLGEVVHQLSARPGDTRSREAVLLGPGTYTVRVAVFTLDEGMAPEIGYNIRWTAISDPFVGDPNDPTANPFACTEPGMEGFYCYPGEIISTDPTLWDSFIESQANPPPDKTRSDTLSNLFSDWWSWIWNQLGENGPVFANNDNFQAPVGAALIVGNSSLVSSLSVWQSNGLLANDLDPEGSSFIAALHSPPSHGTLQLAADGSFTYLPEAGFIGVDQFTYTAFDFASDSNIAVVRIVVGDSADFDADGIIGGRDFLAWQRGFGKVAATLADGDANMDEVVDGLDLAVWQGQYVDVSTPPVSNGDTEGDGDVDGYDFLAWQRGYGLTSGALPAQGDANGDQAVDALDLAVWQANYGSSGGAAVAAMFSAVNEEPALLALPLEAAPSVSHLNVPSAGDVNDPIGAVTITSLELPRSITTTPTPRRYMRPAQLKDFFQPESQKTGLRHLPTWIDSAIKHIGAPTDLSASAASRTRSTLIAAWDEYADEISAEAVSIIRRMRLSLRLHRFTSQK